MKLFMDSEFTGLIQNTDLISIALVAEDSRYFYAEFNDYDEDKIDEWLSDNIIANLKFNGVNYSYNRTNHNSNVPVNNSCSVRMKGNKQTVTHELKMWLDQFDDVEIWSDCLAYDWVLFCELFGGAFKVPSNVYYIPFDICTLFKDMGIDPDISREDFAGDYILGDLPVAEKHNALWDAFVIKACYEGLVHEKESSYVNS